MKPKRWLDALLGDRDRRAGILIAAAVVAAVIARVGTVDWDAPFRLHPDELGFVMWVAAHTEWNGFVHHTFEPTVTTYGPLVYELALATKWALSGTTAASAAAHAVPDGWAYLGLLDDPQRTPLTMNQWIHAMRLVSAWAGVLTVLVLTRATRRLAGLEASVIVAWLAALSPGLVQVSHFYTPDGLLMLFEVMLLDASTLLLDRPSAKRASYAGVAIGLVLATKMTGGLAALLVPWAIYIRREQRADVTRVGALMRACFAGPTWIAAGVAVVTYVALCPWILLRGPTAYFSDGGGPTSGAFMLQTLYESDFGFYDWRFPYRDLPRGVPFLSWLLPYAVGTPVVLAGLAGLFVGERRTRLLAWGLFAPSLALVSGWSVMTIRYALPLVPPLLVSASALLAHTARLRWPQRSVPSRVLGTALLTLVMAPSLARGLAWVGMFAAEDPRTRASRWVSQHARDGDIVVTEPDFPYTAPLGARDETTGALPYPMPRLVVRRLYGTQPLGPELAAHTTRLARGARYLVVSGWMAGRARSRAALEHAPEHAAFYNALFAGRSDFREVAHFESTPTLGPLRWREDREEQLAVCIDHCPVWIFERTADSTSTPPQE